MNITQKYRDRISEAVARGLFCVWIEETGKYYTSRQGAISIVEKRAWQRYEIKRLS